MPASKLFDLSGRTALVTGGNGGIGRTIALAFAESGASVAILARNRAKNQKVLVELEKAGARAIAIDADITDKAQIEPAVARVAKEFGSVDILVNNAGIGLIKPSLEIPLEEWDRVLATNLTACFLMSQAAGRLMAKRKTGKIINISSIYGLVGNALAPSYSATKGALIQLTKSMAIELAPVNVQVNAIVPGYFRTEMTDRFKNEPFYNELIRRVPAGRWGETEELAGAAIFLASAASNFVTGTSVVVDGGFAAS
jgi:2-dehydro-3-deoxy-D-gluconate 5-dehydrogenase